MCSKYNPCTPKNSTNISVINSTRIGTCYGALIHPTIDHGLGWWHQWPKGTTKTGLLLYTPEKLTWQWKKPTISRCSSYKKCWVSHRSYSWGSNFDHVFTYRNMFHWTSRIPFQKKQTNIPPELFNPYVCVVFGEVQFQSCLLSLSLDASKGELKHSENPKTTF